MLNDHDSSHAATMAIENDRWLAHLKSRPHVLMRPRVFPDGNKWCALYGENLHDGVAGFGDTPAAACEAFDAEWEGR